MDVNFPPIPQSQENLQTYLQALQRTLTDALSSLELERAGRTNITGSVSIPTGLTHVDRVVASFYDDPIAGAFVLAARPDSTPGSVLINVFTNAGAASTTAINVTWVAYGY